MRYLQDILLPKLSFFRLCLCVLWIGIFSTATSMNAAERGSIKGRVAESLNNQPIGFATVFIRELGKGTTTEDDGAFALNALQEGAYTLEISFVGFREKVLTDIMVRPGHPVWLDIQLEENTAELAEVVVRASPFSRSVENINSAYTLRGKEITSQAGAKSDLSRAMQALPGVAGLSALSNGLIIRGGAAYENAFYLDGIRIPVINHFEGMNTTGGSIGILNPAFISEIAFNSGAFAANKGDVLSSIIEFKQRNGRNDRQGFELSPSITDARLLLEGPVSKKTTYLIGLRRSLSNALFRLYGFPHLPTYTDAQFKVNTVLSSRHEFFLTGVIAEDRTLINSAANRTEEQRFFLNQVPSMQQRNYAFGLGYKHYRKNGFSRLTLSRNGTKGHFEKYFRNDASSLENLLLDFNTQRDEISARLEDIQHFGDYKLNVGGDLSSISYESTAVRQGFTEGQDGTHSESKIDFKKYGLFAQISRRWWQERLSFSFGFRVEKNNLLSARGKKFSALSPRFAWSIALSKAVKVNFGSGIYYQTPPLVLLGYRNTAGDRNQLKYMRSHHLTLGAEWQKDKTWRLTAETYFKRYTDYPFQLRDSIAWLNQNGIVGFTGHEEARSSAKGNVWGAEFMLHRRSSDKWQMMLAYTFSESLFSDRRGILLPSAFDARHKLNFTLNRSLGKHCSMSIGYNFQSALPFTPFAAASDYVSTWLAHGGGVKDYKRLNSERGRPQHILNLRLERAMKIKKFDFTFFFDIRNVLGNRTGEKVLVADIGSDEAGNPLFEKAIINPDAPLPEQKIRYTELDGFYGKPIPTIGFSFGK